MILLKDYKQLFLSRNSRCFHAMQNPGSWPKRLKLKANPRGHRPRRQLILMLHQPVNCNHPCIEELFIKKLNIIFSISEVWRQCTTSCTFGLFWMDFAYMFPSMAKYLCQVIWSLKILLFLVLVHIIVSPFPCDDELRPVQGSPDILPTERHRWTPTPLQPQHFEPL